MMEKTSPNDQPGTTQPVVPSNPTVMTPVQIQAEQYAYTIGLHYAGMIGTPTRGVNIRGGFGYGRFAFLLGYENNDLVPPFIYDHIYLYLSGYIPFNTNYIGLDLEIGYLGVLDIGSLAITAYNAKGNTPSSQGVHFFAGLSGKLFRGLRWRLAFEFLGFFTKHSGIGTGWGSLDSPETTIGDAGGIQTIQPTKDFFWRIIPQIFYRFGGSSKSVETASGSGWFEESTQTGASENTTQQARRSPETPAQQSTPTQPSPETASENGLHSNVEEVNEDWFNPEK